MKDEVSGDTMVNNKKLVIYYGDLVHDYLGAGSYSFPLNIGFVSAYAKKMFGDRIQNRLFKYPGELISAIQTNPPDIISLSNYTWNAHLNGQIASLVKKISPDIPVIFGGPNIDLSPEGFSQFIGEYPWVDFYVLCEGERGFSNILERYFASNFDLNVTKEEPIEGCVLFRNGVPAGGKLLPRIEDIADVPSPYLTGTLDQFFDTNLIPIIETSRGCPFSCVFCAQGLTSRHIVKYFPLDRVIQELEYIAARTHKTNILEFADANFGIHPRDIEIGTEIKKISEKTGYPRNCSINWVKTEKSIRVAEIMGDSVSLVSSLQSIDPIVLESIKRKNIDSSVFKKIVDYVNSHGGVSGTEIILGLPSETKESHSNSLRELFNWGVSHIICYNCLIIHGSEMSSPSMRARYKMSTKFRLLDSAYGKYGNGAITSFEFEEGIRCTSTMSEEDILYFRPVHWLIQMCWNYRIYYPLFILLSNRGFNQYDFIVALMENLDHAPKTVQDLFADFKKEARDEWFTSPEELRKYYTDHFDTLEKGEVGKMNYKYTWRVILECKRDFDTYVQDVAIKLMPGSEMMIRDVTAFSSSSLIDFDLDVSTVESKTLELHHDILSWQGHGYTGEPELKQLSVMFYLPPEKRNALKVLYIQYQHQNRNVMMRKMSENIRIDDLFYEKKIAG